MRLEAMPKAVVEVYVLVLQAHGGELGKGMSYKGGGLGDNMCGGLKGRFMYAHIQCTDSIVLHPHMRDLVSWVWGWV